MRATAAEPPATVLDFDFMTGACAPARSFHEECIDTGWRSAAAKLRLDDKGPAAYIEAYKTYKGPRKAGTYFLRKHLGLRLNALKRGMVADPSVTPEFLAHITAERCPVTLKPLSFDSRGQSGLNPSIDRLVNEVGYLAGNLCVLSQHANRAKGDKSFEEVAQIASAGEPQDGLQPVEWMRMASLMYGAWARAFKRQDPYLLPLAAIAGGGMFMSTSQTVQLMLTRHFSAGMDHDGFTQVWLQMTRAAGCEEAAFLALRDELVQALAEVEHAGDAWLRSSVFEAFVSWYGVCRDTVNGELLSLLQRHQSRQPDPLGQRDWPARR